METFFTAFEDKLVCGMGVYLWLMCSQSDPIASAAIIVNSVNYCYTELDNGG